MASSSATETAKLLTEYARERLRRGDGLTAKLSEREKEELTQELVDNGWRSHSPALQQTLSKVTFSESRIEGSLSDQEARIGEEKSYVTLSDVHSIAQRPLEGGGSNVAESMDGHQGEHFWTVTEEDLEVMNLPHHPSETAVSKQREELDIQTVHDLPYFEEEWEIKEHARFARATSNASLAAMSRATSHSNVLAGMKSRSNSIIPFLAALMVLAKEGEALSSDVDCDWQQSRPSWLYVMSDL
eukprot:CAMPEP_0206037766 /NCGR_PEP_ID=MMETSP1466-20131121/3665_1 /ASSEMBLY_ACC=CAM_ASM_001126 /TAXON_ID=44452 /ORGANISM="Pavlova gyrans, Strain CCMP608" /LENGTH=242 /DNA_ID=CAMNT_0053412333 /DNA_START=11 /DNA_END=740 /DNA_ORIENTATION=+